MILLMNETTEERAEATEGGKNRDEGGIEKTRMMVIDCDSALRHQTLVGGGSEHFSLKYRQAGRQAGRISGGRYIRSRYTSQSKPVAGQEHWHTG